MFGATSGEDRSLELVKRDKWAKAAAEVVIVFEGLPNLKYEVGE